MARKSSAEVFRLLEELPSENTPEASTGQSDGRCADTAPFRNLVPQTPSGRIVHRNRDLIRQIYDDIAAQLSYRKRLAEARTPESSSVIEQLESLDWNRRDDTNFDHIILLLSLAMEKKSAADLERDIREDGKRNVYELSRLVYPGMPVCIIGTIDDNKDVNEREILLHTESFNIVIMLHIENAFHHDLSFLVKRHVFVLGVVKVVEAGMILVDAGAVLL